MNSNGSPPVFGESPRDGVRGVGGSLYSPYSEERGGLEAVLVQNQAEPAASNPPPHSESDGTSVAGTLETLGVLVLAPAQQRVMALALVGAGVTCAQILDIAGWIAETEPNLGQRRKYLAATLADPVRCLEASRQINRYRIAHADDKSAGHMPNMPIGTPSCSCGRCVEARRSAPPEPLDHDRQCRMAWCRVNGDRASTALVAREMGVSESTMKTMVDRGRVLSTSAVEVCATPKVEEPRDSEKRIEEFRCNMRTSSARQPRQWEALDFQRLQVEQARIMAGVRERGLVPIGEVIHDKHKRGALATLEVDGFIQRAGDLDAAMQQPYRVAQDADERERFRLEFRVAAQNELNRPRPKHDEVSA